MRILVVEDEIDLCSAIAEGLTIAGYVVETTHDGLIAEELISSESYDLAILDLNLPGMNGMDILKETRKKNQEIKILILSARDCIEDKVNGLDKGANDYLTKPFSFLELEARVRSLLGRKFVQSNTILKHDTLTLDIVKKKVTINQTEIKLTRKEFALLEYFLINKEKVISQENLMEHVWKKEADCFSNAVRVHIASLRKKIKKELHYDLIETIIGEGYRLKEVDQNV